MPRSQQRVSLAAPGPAAPEPLPRHRRQALEIGLDRRARVAAEGKDAVIRFASMPAELHAITSAGRQRVSAPAVFASRWRDRRCWRPRPRWRSAIAPPCCLARPLTAPVASGARFVFGRSAPMLAALRVLDSPRFLRRAEGVEAASADRIGLSRNAFSFEAAGGGYKICRLSATQALYHLDEQAALCRGHRRRDGGQALPAAGRPPPGRRPLRAAFRRLKEHRMLTVPYFTLAAMRRAWSPRWCWPRCLTPAAAGGATPMRARSRCSSAGHLGHRQPAAVAGQAPQAATPATMPTALAAGRSNTAPTVRLMCARHRHRRRARGGAACWRRGHRHRRAHGDWWQVKASVDGKPVSGWASSLWLRRADERALLARRIGL
jgi:hypothetical protein